MSPKRSRAATAATARVVSPMRLYDIQCEKSSLIDEILARLLFGLASPHLSPTERTGVLDVIDGLIRLKIDRGLLRGGRR